MVTVYFDFSMFPEDFVRRNKRAYETRNPEFCHDSGLYESYITKGTEIAQVSFEKNYPFSDYISILAPQDGYIHYNPYADVCRTYKGSEKAKLCDIYDSFEDQADVCFPSIPK